MHRLLWHSDEEEFRRNVYTRVSEELLGVVSVVTAPAMVNRVKVKLKEQKLHLNVFPS